MAQLCIRAACGIILIHEKVLFRLSSPRVAIALKLGTNGNGVVPNEERADFGDSGSALGLGRKKSATSNNKDQDNRILFNEESHKGKHILEDPLGLESDRDSWRVP